MKALVVGGGIAGPAAAMALAKAGIEPLVLERRPVVDPEAGSWFTVAPNGLDALEAIDALDAVRDQGVPSRANVIYGATGRRLGEVSLGQPLDNGLVALTMKRSWMAARLKEEAERRGIVVQRGAEISDVTDAGDRVEAVLTDGTLVTADLLVGADGVHSRVRQAIDVQAPAARYVGLTNFGGIARNTPIAGDLEPEAWHFIFGSQAFFGAHPTTAGDVVWFVNVPEPEISRERRRNTTEDEWAQRLLSLVADDAGPAAELVRTGRLELAGDNTYDLGHVPTWFRGRMVIIGDAAHAPSPSSGQGASMALEDAVVLAQALRDHADAQAAFAAYEGARRERVEKIVAVGARSSSSKIPGPIGRRFQELMLRFAFRYMITDRSVAWINDHRIRWEDPVGDQPGRGRGSVRAALEVPHRRA
jgi:2-polyprenyl-6-methoxyphenol hydroxylase-like FAD-dependent oxidoreductase